MKNQKARILVSNRWRFALQRASYLIHHLEKRLFTALSSSPSTVLRAYKRTYLMELLRELKLLGKFKVEPEC